MGIRLSRWKKEKTAREWMQANKFVRESMSPSKGRYESSSEKKTLSYFCDSVSVLC